MTDDNRPRSYNLDDASEIARLYRELRGYIATCVKQHHGTDYDGRRHAFEALEKLCDLSPQERCHD